MWKREEGRGKMEDGRWKRGKGSGNDKWIMDTSTCAQSIALRLRYRFAWFDRRLLSIRNAHHIAGQVMDNG